MEILFKKKKYNVENQMSIIDFVKDVIGIKKINFFAAKINGKLVDLSAILDEDCEIEFVDFASEEGKSVYWHSTAHIMAQAVKELYPETKVTIGPSIENGFYYDFDRETPFTPEDLEKIENQMMKNIKADYQFVREEITRENAIKLFNEMGENYKVEIINDLPEDAVISIYRNGNFVDLCRGPHVPSTGVIKAVKLISVAGAYWRGDANNKMLQRIYGISFPSTKDLRKYLNFLEEARKRDHRKIGKQLDLFSINENIGPGLIIWHPNGAVIRNEIENFWKKEHMKAGYKLIYTPHVGKSVLWETSGHLGFYKENMYAKMDIDNNEYYIKPMNCPFHIMYYNSSTRSYRDLPMKLAELGTVYRYEHSGVLHGLLRVRGFTQDDAHIICTHEQLEDEVLKILDFALNMLRTFGFKEFDIYLSTRPEKAVGEEDKWDAATKSLRLALEKRDIDYKIDEGGGAFYGPKIDIKIKDALGRSWQCTTVQFDFNLPERFNMTYIDTDGREKQPYMIHRALLGSLERFFGTLIEHYNGNFPLWLAPVQVKVLTITSEQNQYAQNIFEKLLDADIRAELDIRNEKISYKIRNSEVMKVPYAIIIGAKEVEEKVISIRKHRKGNIGQKKLSDFIEQIKMEIKEKK